MMVTKILESSGKGGADLNLRSLKGKSIPAYRVDDSDGSESIMSDHAGVCSPLFIVYAHTDTTMFSKV
jgi:hypothetical protein